MREMMNMNSNNMLAADSRIDSLLAPNLIQNQSLLPLMM